MKKNICLFSVFVLLPLISFAQQSFSSLCRNNNQLFSFLSINTDVHYRGIGEIGVVSSGRTKTDIAWKENPALLGGVGNHLAIESNVLASSELLSGDLVNINGHFSVSSKIRVGLDATHLSTDLVLVDKTGIPMEGRFPYISALTTSIGIQLNDYFSVGMGLTFVESDIYSAYYRIDEDIYRTLLLQYGLHYQREQKIGNTQKLKMEGGLSLTNIGMKKSYGIYSDFQNHLPAAVQLGGRIGWEKRRHHERGFGVNLIAQIDYRLFPECSLEDLNLNLIPDYLEQTSLDAAASNFNKHSDGLKGEWNAMTKRIALRPWWDISKNWQLGMGIAYVSRAGQSYFTAGLNAMYRNFQLDISKGRDNSVGLDGPSVFGISLGYSKALKRNK